MKKNIIRYFFDIQCHLHKGHCVPEFRAPPLFIHIAPQDPFSVCLFRLNFQYAKKRPEDTKTKETMRPKKKKMEQFANNKHYQDSDA